MSESGVPASQVAATNAELRDFRQDTTATLGVIKDLISRHDGRMSFLFGENGQPGWVLESTRKIDKLERDRTFLAGAWAVLVFLFSMFGLRELLVFIGRHP